MSYDDISGSVWEVGQGPLRGQGWWLGARQLAQFDLARHIHDPR